MTPYYEGGGVTLYHGDCREIDAWRAADVLVTDPPYGHGYASNKHDSAWRDEPIGNDDDTSCRDAALALWGDRPAVVFGSWKRKKPDATRAVLIWDKGMGVGMGDLAMPWKPNYEEVYVLGRGFHGHRGSAVLQGHTMVSWASKGRQHPNMKPESLMLSLLAKCPAGVVADPFAGSGTTLVAAKRLGRRAIGIELDEVYCEVIASRLAQGALFEVTA